jgi:ABC-type dipeptide/oligopeptide/nickel transport system ATPase subunit
MRGIVEAVWEGVQAGVNVTASAIATLTGMTQGNVSLNLKRKLGIGFKALKKILQTLFKALHRKSNISESLSDDEIWIAKQYLPMVWKQIEETLDPVVAVEEISGIAKSFGWQSLERILAATDLATLLGLLKSVIRSLPISVSQHLDLAPG